MIDNIVGIAWYKPENFDRLREMYEDGNMFKPVYSEWHRNAEIAFLHHQGRGVNIVKVDIDPESFPLWCASEGLGLNAKGRLAYLEFIAGKVASVQSCTE